MSRGETLEDWRALYLMGAAAAALTVVSVPAHIGAFVAWPPPLDGTALDWFEVFESSRLVGLLSMDLLLMLDYALLVPIYAALFVSLSARNPSIMVLGTALGLVSMAIYFASNPAIEMMSLSERYAAAATDAERSLLAAAGEATAERYQGTAFHVSYILGSFAGILVSWPMRRSSAFGSLAAWAGIMGNIVGLGLYVPVVGLTMAVLSGPVLWIWFVLVLRGFVRLARDVGAPR
jgi:hypothetical protein